MPAVDLSRQQWRQLAIGAYLPTGLSMIGFGAISPLVAITALRLGADVPTAAFVVGLMGLGQLLGALPAGALAGRIGEKNALITALWADVAILITAFLAPNVAVFGAVMFLAGVSGSVLALARQAYLTEVVPAGFRARALSTLGGVFRIGSFLGPLLGAGVVSQWGVTVAYLVAAGTSTTAAVITMTLPDLPGEVELARKEAQTRLWPVLRDNLSTYLTVGLGGMLLMLVRAARDAIIPLWCEANGLTPATTSLIYAVSAGVDMLLFYAGGMIMDRYGRRWVAVPSIIVMALCFGLLVLTHGVWTIGAVGVGLGLGNGISSGVVMTMGSDASPALGRAQFLAGWRLTTGLGQALGPVVITAVSAATGLAAASLAIMGLGLVGALWLWRWVPPRRPPD